jgi:23S rRNA pseudouridine2605 synthase
MERIQKILARGGIASRRAAEQLIASGRVRVNGRIVTELGTKADPRRDRVEVDGKRVVAEQPLYIIVHKPRGVVSTMSDPEGRPTVKDLLQTIGARVYPVGRLDFATSGILLATNDGAFADGLLHPRRDVPKRYVVKVKGTMQGEDLDPWRKGVRLEDGMTLPAEAKLLRHEGDKTWFELTIREGRNQQIRRMGEATGFPVMRLSRVGFADVTIEGLPPGKWRHLTRDELLALKKAYGVPRSIPAGEHAPPTVSRRGPQARRGTAGRAQRAFGEQAREQTREQAKGPRFGGGAPGRRSYEVTDDWGGGVERGSTRGGSSDEQDQGRRGRSGDKRDEERPRSEIGGGRFGRTRTTGTAGGIGANGPAPRVKGRSSGEAEREGRRRGRSRTR